MRGILSLASGNLLVNIFLSVPDIKITTSWGRHPEAFQIVDRFVVSFWCNCADAGCTSLAYLYIKKAALTAATCNGVSPGFDIAESVDPYAFTAIRCRSPSDT